VDGLNAVWQVCLTTIPIRFVAPLSGQARKRRIVLDVAKFRQPPGQAHVLLKTMGDFDDISGWRRLVALGARVLAIVLALVAVPAASLVLIPPTLKAMADPMLDAPPLPGSGFTFTFLDRSGKLMGRQGPVAGVPLSLPEMPAHLPAAFLAAEDKRFFHHDGVDFPGLLRAFRANWDAGRVVAGGSTISQQTAKLLTGDRARTYDRKWRELMATAALEKRFSKREILEIYLNRIYLGDGAHGVDAASRAYFGISAREITVAQAAILAGLARAPSAQSPRRDHAVAQARAHRVLAAMVESGAITHAQAEAARMQTLALVPARRDDHDHVLDAAAQEARKIVLAQGLTHGAFTVHTAIDSTLQATAQATAAQAVKDGGKAMGFTQAALVTMTPDGAIRAMVGGLDYKSSVFNRVTQAKRQPGSAFKPFVYAAALERGVTPWDWREDRAVNIGGYQPANYRHATYGALQLTDALARSVNTITVSLAQEVGIGAVAATARRLGITSHLEAYPSLALGTEVVTPLELTAAYAVFANHGMRVRPHLVTRIEGAFDGAGLYARDMPAEAPVLGEGVRRDMTAMLYNVVLSGTGAAAQLDMQEAAGKTGTSQDYRDAWFIGFTPQLVTGVWVGNDNNSPMRAVTGGRVPALIWKTVMAAGMAGQAPVALDRSQPPVLGMDWMPARDWLDDIIQTPYLPQTVVQDMPEQVTPADIRPGWREIRANAVIPDQAASRQRQNIAPQTYQTYRAGAPEEADPWAVIGQRSWGTR